MAVRTHRDVVTPQQKIREEGTDHVVCKCNTGRRAPKAVYLYLLATCDQCMRKGNRPTLCQDDLLSAGYTIIQYSGKEYNVKRSTPSV
jgi:hypothetical protein